MGKIKALILSPTINQCNAGLPNKLSYGLWPFSALMALKHLGSFSPLTVKDNTNDSNNNKRVESPIKEQDILRTRRFWMITRQLYCVRAHLVRIGVEIITTPLNDDAI